MSDTATNRTAARAPARRVGYAIAAALNVAGLCVVNIWPGWHALSFLTADTAQLIVLVNLLLIASLVVNLTYLAYDAPWLRSLGDLLTTGIGLAVLVRFWQVFPFDFGGSSFDWELVVRVVLIVGIIGASIGLVVQLVMLVRRLVR